MNANFDIDTQELVQQITQTILNALKPHLNSKDEDNNNLEAILSNFMVTIQLHGA